MRPVIVQVTDGIPQLVMWNRRKLDVSEIIDCWSEVGRWWEHEGECQFYLIETRIGILLLGYDLSSHAWYVKPVQ